MATIIKSVSFQNFYNYYGRFEQNIYEFKEGINIVNADNNMGKSKFYNGFLWILINNVYDSDLKRQEGATSSFLKMASGKAKCEETDFKMGVRIVIMEEETEYSITKTVLFQYRGTEWSIGNEMTDIVQTYNGRTIPVLDIVQKENIVKKIIPTELLSYALLQGESMEKLVNLSSRDGLSSTIETLAGMSNLVNIFETCSDLTKKSKKLLATKETEFSSNEDKVVLLTEEKEKLDEYIESSTKKIAEYQKEFSDAKNQKEELEALQLNATKREKFRGIKEQITNEIKILQLKIVEKEKNITSMLFAGSASWLLLGLKEEINTFSSFRDDLNIDRTKLQISKDPTIFLPEGSPDVPSLKRMLEKGVCEVCGRDAARNTVPWKHIEMIMNRPKKEGVSSKNDFSLFFSNIQTTIGSFYNSSSEIEDNIERYRNDIDLLKAQKGDKNDEYENAKLEYINAGGENHSDRDTISSYSLAERKEADCRKSIEETKTSILRWQQRITQIEDELSDFNRNDKVNEYRVFRDTMCLVETMFAKTKDRIYDEIIKSLEANANQKYSDLTSGNSTSGGKLYFIKQEDSTVHVSIKDVLNGEMTGLGTGFQRMKQLSIVMAIISSKIGNKQFNYPFISDAPFSEFGDNFINNFFQVAPKVFRQSIILVKELFDPKDPDLLNPLGKKVLKEMKDEIIQGTFYVNVIEEEADTTNLVTRNKCYKY